MGGTYFTWTLSSVSRHEDVSLSLRRCTIGGKHVQYKVIRLLTYRSNGTEYVPEGCSWTKAKARNRCPEAEGGAETHSSRDKIPFGRRQFRRVTCDGRPRLSADAHAPKEPSLYSAVAVAIFGPNVFDRSITTSTLALWVSTMSSRVSFVSGRAHRTQWLGCTNECLHGHAPPGEVLSPSR